MNANDIDLRTARINRLPEDRARHWAERTVSRWHGFSCFMEGTAYPDQDSTLPGGDGVWLDYVNAGDAYDLTLYRIGDGPWTVGCWGDAVETLQAEYAEEEDATA